jgi:rhamnogalacturonan endolyase
LLLSINRHGPLDLTLDRSTGDITSLKYNNVEYQGTTKNSAINSGLGSSTVTAETISGYIKVTVKSSGNPVTQYYVAKPNDPTIYMGTYITGEVSPGELRWLARMKHSLLPNGVNGNVGETNGCTAFEGKDTFKCSNGQTRCKMYTSDRFIYDIVHGVTGNVSVSGLVHSALDSPYSDCARQR